MTKIEVDRMTVDQIRSSEGPIELVDSVGETVGIVRRPPSAEEIARAKSRSSRGGETLTWGQLMAKVKEEVKQ